MNITIIKKVNKTKVLVKVKTISAVAIDNFQLGKTLMSGMN